MIPIIIKAAFCLGIQISVRIISFIADQLSQEEEKKRKNFLEQYNRLNEEAEVKRNKFADELKERYKTKMQAEIEQENKRQIEFLKAEAKPKRIELILNDLNDRNDYVDNVLLKEIDSALEKLKENKKLKYNSALRHNSFNLLYEELKEAKDKAKAYKSYLKKYQSNLSKIYDCCSDDDEILFSYTLPKKFPYNNKLIFLSADCFDTKTGEGKITLHGCIDISFYISDYDFYCKEALNNIVVQQIGYDTNKYSYIYSIQHGRYKQVAKSGGFTGVTAKVYGYGLDNKSIILTYEKDMRLDLSTKNLYNFDRYPVIGSEITVFPLNEYYSDKEKRVVYNVSQRCEDAEISLDFHEIPFILPKEKQDDFMSYFTKNSIAPEYSDVKIAPVLETGDSILHLNEVKLQLGETHTIIAKIKSDTGNRNYLWFEGFAECTKLTADDIFIPFNAEIYIILETEYNDFVNKESNKQIFDNMNDMILTIYKEFDLQYKLKNSQDGMRYFTAWENITKVLKRYVEKGASITCKTEDIPQYKSIHEKGQILKFKTSNPKLLKKYYEKILVETENTHLINEFFTEYNKTYYEVEISPDCESFNVIVPLSEGTLKENENITDELALLPEITIYKRNYGIPEHRQLQALHNFKIGSLRNNVLQLYMLNGSRILPSCENKKIDKLYNNSLKENESQYNSLIRSLNENNIFFIQGPPGTGKTTVIRELIAQTINFDTHSKVLIVSQANVAVDNVIKGLVRDDMPFTKDDIIRCGRSGKISSEISDMSYEKKYEDYLSRIRKLANDSKDTVIRELSKKWLNKIETNYGYNPDIGELIIRNHKIIGATCVGLTQKHIGIDKLVFDLVIIDEAGKALAPEIVIPMLQAKKAVIIGDHKQLPAVINPALYDEEKIELDERQYCKKEIFDVSYFQKLFESCPDENKSSLDTQYRMPAVIGTMISKLFYNGKLRNGIGTETKKPIYSKCNLSLIDMSNEKEYIESADKGSSPVNHYEARYVLHLLKKIKEKKDNIKIAVITPYKGQKAYIRRLLINNGFDKYKENNIFIDTVDSFQGDEADIVIYCTTRSQKQTKFLSDRRRINVAVSRARNEFIMIASTSYLSGYPNKEPIRQVLEYIRENGDISSPDKIEKANSSINKEIVRMKDLIIGSGDEDKLTYAEKIKYEVEHYNRNGYFSCYPLVDRIDDFFLLKTNEEIYYAAIELSLSEIYVELSQSENISSNFLHKDLELVQV